jgi:hypothetical protein
MMKSPLMSIDGGPIISLERTEKEDSLSVVWMSIDSRSYPISGYLIFLNDQQCGSRVSNIYFTIFKMTILYLVCILYTLVIMLLLNFPPSSPSNLKKNIF